jgi:hypothetical protein
MFPCADLNGPTWCDERVSRIYGSEFQHGSARITPMRVFYKDSILQVFNTNHIVEIYSYDDGRTWNMVLEHVQRNSCFEEVETVVQGVS